MYLVAQEFYSILPGLLYLIMIPAGYMVMTIYFITNLHVVSWGTRESQQVKTISQLEKERQKTEVKKLRKSRRKSGILGWLGAHALMQEVGNILKQVQQGLLQFTQKKSDSVPAKSRTDQLLEELIAEIRRGRAGVGQVDESSQNAPLNESNHDCLSTQNHVPSSVGNQGLSPDLSDSSDVEESNTLMTSIGYHAEDPRQHPDPPGSENEEQAPEPQRHLVPPDDVKNPSWLTSNVCGEGPVTQLTQRELTFWMQLINRYLYPLCEDKAYSEKINADLKALRDNVVFFFVMISALWLALTMQLEASWGVMLNQDVHVCVCVCVCV